MATEDQEGPRDLSETSDPSKDPVLSEKKKGALTNEVEKFLEEGKSDQTWRVRVKELTQYKEEHGDCLVPARYHFHRKLGHWVMTQRRQYAFFMEGKPSSLCQEKVDKLNKLGFVWKVRESNNFVWDQRLKDLAKYKEKHGHCLVPQRYPPNLSLGTWVNTQRRHYKLFMSGKPSIMTEKRIEALQKLDFDWHPKKTSKERDNLQETSRGDTSVAPTTSTTGILKQGVQSCLLNTQYYVAQHSTTPVLQHHFGTSYLTPVHTNLTFPFLPVASRFYPQHLLCFIPQHTNNALRERMTESTLSICLTCGKTYDSSSHLQKYLHGVICTKMRPGNKNQK